MQFFFPTQSNFLSWAPILSNVKNQSNHFRGTRSSFWISQSIQDFISVTFSFEMLSGICLLSCPPWGQQRWGPLLSFVVRKSLHSAPRWSVAGWSGRALSQHCDVLPPTPGVIVCPQPLLHTLISTSIFVSPHMPSRADVGTVRPPALRYSSRMIQWLLLRQAVSSSSTHSSTLSHLGTWVWMKGLWSFLPWT